MDIQATHGQPLQALRTFRDMIDAGDSPGFSKLAGMSTGSLSILLGRLERREAAATLAGSSLAEYSQPDAFAGPFNETVEGVRTALA